MFGKVPASGNWDIDPRGKHVEFKKAVKEGFLIFFWPQYKDYRRFFENENMKQYVDGVMFYGNKVLTGGDEAAIAAYKKYLSLCEDLYK